MQATQSPVLQNYRRRVQMNLKACRYWVWVRKARVVEVVMHFGLVKSMVITEAGTFAANLWCVGNSFAVGTHCIVVGT